MQCSYIVAENISSILKRLFVNKKKQVTITTINKWYVGSLTHFNSSPITAVYIAM